MVFAKVSKAGEGVHKILMLDWGFLEDYMETAEFPVERGMRVIILSTRLMSPRVRLRRERRLGGEIEYIIPDYREILASFVGVELSVLYTNE